MKNKNETIILNRCIEHYTNKTLFINLDKVTDPIRLADLMNYIIEGHEFDTIQGQYTFTITIE